jgi:PhnB protein
MAKTATQTKALMPIITVPSVDDIRNFYVDRLGFVHAMGIVGKDGQLDFCTVIKDGARVMFSRNPNGASTSAAPAAGKQPVELYVEVEDVEGYHNELKSKQVSITEPLTMQWWGDRTFKVMDPAGYVVWFFEHVGDMTPPAGTKLV